MPKITVTAPANIAFIKYWGARDLERALPLHPSISMTLSRCLSRTTVEYLPAAPCHQIYLAAEDGSLSEAPEAFRGRIEAHLDRLRLEAGESGHFKVATRNSFPSSAGLASSASGFAALTLGATRAMGLDHDSRQLSILARRSGSGSAARSVMGGYVEWPAADSDPHRDDSCYASQWAPRGHWDLADVIALVETGAKGVSSLDGHRRAATSPHFERRLEEIPRRLESVRRAITERDFPALATAVEEDSIELHLIAMSSRPPIFYWKPGTLAVLEAVRTLRAAGTPVCATMDAGANVHVICPRAVAESVEATLAQMPTVVEVIRDHVGDGPQIETRDLF